MHVKARTTPLPTLQNTANVFARILFETKEVLIVVEYMHNYWAIFDTMFTLNWKILPSFFLFLTSSTSTMGTCLCLFPLVSFVLSLQTKHFPNSTYDKACKCVFVYAPRSLSHSAFAFHRPCIFEMQTLMKFFFFLLLHAVFFGNISNVLHILYIRVLWAYTANHRFYWFPSCTYE